MCCARRKKAVDEFSGERDGPNQAVSCAWIRLHLHHICDETVTLPSTLKRIRARELHECGRQF
jgi:hypothetical protein